MEKQAEKALGVSRSTLYRWRTGLTQPSPRMRNALASTCPDQEWGTPFESDTWVRAARRELGLGQEDFAIACGVTQSNVSKWENGSLVLDRESASELHEYLELSAALDPASPLVCETDEDAARRYADHTRSLIIESRPDADWGAAQLCSSICGLANMSVEAGRILASIHANRSLWNLVHQDYSGAARHAYTAIRLGKHHGFNLDSGYAFWSLARTRFLPGFGTSADVELLSSELSLAESRQEDVNGTYISLLRGARAMAVGDGKICTAEFERAQNEVPCEGQYGVVGRWSQVYWQRDITMYQGILSLCSGRYAECCRLIEPLAEEPFHDTMAVQYGQTVARHFFQAANARLGSRERMETNGPLLAPRTLKVIKRHTARLTGSAH